MYYIGKCDGVPIYLIFSRIVCDLVVDLTVAENKNGKAVDKSEKSIESPAFS